MDVAMTPLIATCSRSFNLCDVEMSQIAEILIERGADVELADLNGDRPLHYACRHNLVDQVILLIDNGAELSPLNNKNQTPIMVACDLNNILNMKKIVDRTETIILLLIDEYVKLQNYDFIAMKCGNGETIYDHIYFNGLKKVIKKIQKIYQYFILQEINRNSLIGRSFHHGDLNVIDIICNFL